MSFGFPQAHIVQDIMLTLSFSCPYLGMLYLIITPPPKHSREVWWFFELMGITLEHMKWTGLRKIWHKKKYDGNGHLRSTLHKTGVNIATAGVYWELDEKTSFRPSHNKHHRQSEKINNILENLFRFTLQEYSSYSDNWGLPFLLTRISHPFSPQSQSCISSWN